MKNFITRSALALALWGLAACAPISTATPTQAPTAAPTAVPATATAAPVTIENCGVTQTFAAPPKRAVALNQHATEIMLALALQDRMVGTAYLDDTILPEFADAYAAIPVLAVEYPSREVFLNAQPDFVYGGFASAFSDEEGVGTRDGLRELGIATYLTTSYCERGRPFAMDDVYTDIRNIGAIFGVSERAEALVADLETDLAAVVKAAAAEGTGRPMLLYDSGDTAPFVGAGQGIPNFLIETIGGANIFADTEGSWAEVSWEAVIDRAPEVIILVDATWSSAQEKQDWLLQDANLAGVPAVANQRFVVLPFTATTPGIRVPAGVRAVAAALYPDQFNQ